MQKYSYYLLMIAAVVCFGRFRLPSNDLESGRSGEDQIVFRDGEGRERLVVGRLEIDTYGLRALDVDGRTVRAEVVVQPNGDAVLKLNDKEGRAVAGSVVTPKDGGVVYVRDPSNRFGRAAMEMNRESGLWVGLWDVNSVRLAALERSATDWGLIVRESGRAMMAVINRAARVGWAVLDDRGEAVAKIIRAGDGGLEVVLPEGKAR